MTDRRPSETYPIDAVRPLRCDCGGRLRGNYGTVAIDDQTHHGAFVRCDDCGAVKMIGTTND